VGDFGKGGEKLWKGKTMPGFGKVGMRKAEGDAKKTHEDTETPRRGGKNMVSKG